MGGHGGEGRGGVSERVLVCIFECVILHRVSQCLEGLRGMMIPEFPSNRLPLSFFLLSLLLFFITSSPDPQPRPPPALRKGKKSKVLANTDVNIFMDLCFALLEI